MARRAQGLDAVTGGLMGIASVVVGVALAAASPASSALQLEQDFVLEADNTAPPPLAAFMGDRPGPAGMPGPHGDPRGAPVLPPFIHLNEAQQDKLFELRHAQEPALRAQFKELRRADMQLRALALADNYDEARARQIATRAAQARTEIEMLHAGLQHAAFALLTPEQRKRLDECKPGADGPPPPPSCLPPPR